MAVFKSRDIVDTFEWNQLSQPVFASVTTLASQGLFMAEDLRNNGYQHPEVLFNTSTAILASYHKKNEAWRQITGSFGAGGSFAAGSCSVFVPSLSPSGTLAAGATASKVILTTALPLAVTENQMANRGDGLGFIIRIAGKASGKVEERRVIANTSGTTPTILLNEPLSFVPASGDIYEFLSGSYVTLNTGALAANQFRRYDLLTGNITSLTTTGLIATVPATGNNLVALDEGYVPWNRKCGEGMEVSSTIYDANNNPTDGVTYDASNTLTGGKKSCLQATAIAAGTITGHSTGGDATVLANQWRNYQIRIVEDTTNPTAINQRRRISSHTAGPSAVYTLNSNWTVTPSSTAKFVIGNWSQNIIAMIGGTSTVYNYTHSSLTGGTADTWDTTTWAVKGNTAQAGGSYAFHAFGVEPDELNIAKASNIYLLRGGVNTYDVLDIAGAATGSWTQGLTVPMGTGTYDTINANDLQTMCYNPHTQKGRYFYFFPGITTASLSNQRSAIRLDLISKKVEKVAGMRSTSGNTTTIAGVNAAFISLYQDGKDKLAFWNTIKAMSGTEFWQLPLTR